jgi:hypothetical protein
VAGVGWGFGYRWTILDGLRWAWIRAVVVKGPGAVRQGRRAMGLLSGGAGWRFGVNG